MKPSKRKDNRYMLTKQCKGIKRTFYADTAKDCIKQANAWDGSPSVSATCGIAIGQWMANDVANKSKATQAQYSYLLTYILPILKNIKVSQVIPIHCQTVINKMYKSNLSETTMRHARKVMHVFFEYERKMKRTIKDNPCVDINIPKNITTRKRRAASPEELSKIWEQIEHTHYFNTFQFLLMTGLRPGEICGITKSDIKGNVLTINKSITKHEVSSGKTKTSHRKINLSPVMIDIINRQYQHINSLGIKSNYVFCNRDGGCSNSGLLSTAWARTAKKVTDLTMYEIRHSFVSMMIDDLPIKDLQAFIGHSSSMNTSATYAHIFDAPKQTSQIIDDKISKYLDVQKPLSIPLSNTQIKAK
jgi:integrase